MSPAAPAQDPWSTVTDHLAEALPDQYAGLVVIPNGILISLAMRSLERAGIERVLEVVARAGALAPEQSVMQFRVVDHSLATLEETFRRVCDVVDQHRHGVRSYGIDPRENCVRVGVADTEVGNDLARYLVNEPVRYVIEGEWTHS